MTSTVSLDPDRQRQARQYARLRRRLFGVDLGLTGIVCLAWLGLSGPLKHYLLTYTTNDWLLVAMFGGVFFVSLQILDLPLSYYTGFVLPHRYGMSNQTLGAWMNDQALGLFLSALLGLPVLSMTYWLLRAAGELWWLWAGLGYILFAVVLTNLAPLIIMPLFNKYVPLGGEYTDLAARLTTLANRAGTRVSGIYRFDMSKRTQAANAALTGLGRTRRIILGDTLLSEFTSDEVETVIAHELGHHVHRDIPIGILVSGAITLVGLFLAAQGLRVGTAALGFEGPADIAALPLLVFSLGLFSVVTLPLNNAYSRWREVRADRYALEATGKPDAFASAMTRLANQNLSDADPEPWVVALLYSHPPIRDRVTHAARWASSAPQQV